MGQEMVLGGMRLLPCQPPSQRRVMAAGHLMLWLRDSEPCQGAVPSFTAVEPLFACSASAGLSLATSTPNICLSPPPPQRCDINHKG